MTKTTVIGVVKASREGATCVVDGKRQIIPWGTLRAAAKQDDIGLRGTYQAVLVEANRLAALEKHLTVMIVNRTDTPHGYCAELYDVAGEFMTGRLVGVDFGQDGTHGQARKDAERAKAKLEGRGYTVTIDD